MLSPTTLRPDLMVDRKSSALISRFSRASMKKLRRQFGAALAATSSKDSSASASLHAKTEAVSLCSAAGVRLESTLAHEVLLQNFLWVHVESEVSWCPVNPMPSNLLNLRQYWGSGQVIFKIFIELIEIFQRSKWEFLITFWI